MRARGMGVDGYCALVFALVDEKARELEPRVEGFSQIRSRCDVERGAQHAIAVRRLVRGIQRPRQSGEVLRMRIQLRPR